MLIPCIDLQTGQAVQLVHGRKCELTVSDVFGLLKKFQSHQWLHIIDLDAAIGTGHNNALAQQLCLQARRKYHFKVRIGGGIRTVSRAVEIAKWRPDQLIIGSAAFRKGQINTRFLRALNEKIPRRKIVIALDTARGHITIHGWRRKLALRPADVMPQLEPFCSAFLCTDVDREGTMSGANLQWFRQLRAATNHPIIAAGGINSRAEIRALAKLDMDAAVGMSLYKNRFR
jgi:phosphoribosylformimino-5-aminoimidazole carboxamide ribonucleotide (ProFAR) isomerase